MNSKNFLLIVVWILCTLLILDGALSLINCSSTIANIVGVILTAFYAVLTLKSEFFTSNPFKVTTKK
jgi:hypothetical protein